MLNLHRNVPLERLELHTDLPSLSHAHQWVYWTLRGITSPVFNEFVIWVRGERCGWGSVTTDSWKAVELALGALAERNPDFRVVFRGDCPSFRDGHWLPCHQARSFFDYYLPAVSSKGFAKFEYVPLVDTPYLGLYSL